MTNTKISYTLPQEEVVALKKAMTELFSKFTFLVALDELERKRLYRNGPRSIEFVDDAVEVSTRFPKILPGTFATEDFNSSTTLYRQLSEIKVEVATLLKKIDHTMLALGTQVLRESLTVYRAARHAKNIPGIEFLVERMRTRFKGQGRKKEGGEGEAK